MFTGSKLKPGRSLKGGGFRVKTALRRATKDRMMSAAHSTNKAGSAARGQTQDPKALKDSSQSFSWFSRNHGEAHRVQRLALETRNASNDLQGSTEKAALTSNNAAATEYLSAGLTVDQQTSPKGGNMTIGYDPSRAQFRVLRRPVTTNPMNKEGRKRGVQSKFDNLHQSQSNPISNVIKKPEL